MSTRPHCSSTVGDAVSLEAVLVARVYMYTMFHKVFGGAPTRELLVAIGSQSAIDVVDEYADCSETLSRLRDFLMRLPELARDPAFMWDVEAEYTRHFVGPDAPGALPWESPYLSHETSLFQSSTLNVRKSYAEQGFAARKLNQVPDDHLSLMCCFMAHMAGRALEAFRAIAVDGGIGRFSAFEASIKSQGAFVHAHLNSWLATFARESCTVRDGKESPACLYPQMAKSVAEFAQIDEGFLAETLVWIEEVADTPDSVCKSEEEREARFAVVERAIDSLRELRLFGLEDNELELIAQEERL